MMFINHTYQPSNLIFLVECQINLLIMVPFTGCVNKRHFTQRKAMKSLKLFFFSLLLCFSVMPTANAGYTFDYMTICDNCQSPAAVAKKLVPDYRGDTSEESPEPEEFSVLVLDPVLNKYYYYEVFMDAYSKYAYNSSLSGNDRIVAENALLYYHAKGKIIEAFNRGPLVNGSSVPLSASMVTTNVKKKIENSIASTANEPDCSSPGVVYTDEYCIDLYIDDINDRILKSEVSGWMLVLNSVDSISLTAGKVSLTAKYDSNTNTVFYNEDGGVIIAIKVNSLGTAVIGMDTANSRYANGKSLQYYLSKNSIRNSTGYDTQNFLDVHSCTVTSGSIRAAYRYTITIGPGGSVYVDVHTSVTEKEDPSIEC